MHGVSSKKTRVITERDSFPKSVTRLPELLRKNQRTSAPAARIVEGNWIRSGP
jgi:hypothetical protein